MRLVCSTVQLHFTAQLPYCRVGYSVKKKLQDTDIYKVRVFLEIASYEVMFTVGQSQSDSCD